MKRGLTWRVDKMSDYGKNKDGFALQGRTVFQGIVIDIENKAGSFRTWYDPFGKEKGSTYMNWDYGYARGTNAVDGDEVDVYIGPHKSSDRVFVVRQMKKPGFKEFDEHKVMLGFDNAGEAEHAYKLQYDDPRFFGGLTEISIEDFKDKLASNSEYFTKSSLILHTNSARIGTMSCFSSSKDVNHMSKNREATEILTRFSADAQQKNGELKKALTAAMVSGFAKQKAKEEQYRADLREEQPAIGTNRRMDNHEPPPIPVRRVNVYPQVWTLQPAVVPETKVPYKTGGSLDETAPEYRKR